MSLLRRAFRARIRIKILSTLPALGLLLAMTACGPKPAEPPTNPSPAGPPPQAQASPAEPQVAPAEPQAPAPDGTPGQPQAAAPSQPQAPGQPGAPGEGSEPGENTIDSAPDGNTDSAVLFVRKVQAHWQGVNADTLPAKAMEVYEQRSKDGFLQFRSEEGIVPVKISEAMVLGPEPDYSLRLSAKALVGGQEREAFLVVTKGENNDLFFDSIVLVEPEGRVSYGWSEAASAWVAGQGANPNP